MRSHGLIPTDNLSVTSENNAKRRYDNQKVSEIQSDRYKKYRKDNKIVDDIQHMSSKDFIPDIGSKPIDENIKKKQLKISGKIKLVQSLEKDQLPDLYPTKCLLTFINDSHGPRCDFTYKSYPIRGLQTDILKECKYICFEDTNSTIGFVFNKDKIITKKTGEELKLDILIWHCKLGYEQQMSKLRSLCRTLHHVSKYIRIYTNKNELISQIPMLNTSKNTNFWDKNMKSLTNSIRPSRSLSNSTKSLSLAHKIHIITNDSEEVSPMPSPKKAQNSSSLVLIDTDEPRRTRSSTLGKVSKEVVEDLDDVVPFKPSLYYQFNDGVSYTITNQDFKSLYNNDWVNDTIIDFFIKYNLELNVAKNDREDIFIMSSFFYTKLKSNNTNFYDNVKKWVANSKLFSKKFVIIPINSNYHWYACIITNLIEYYEFVKSDKVNLDSIPNIKILIFDSLRQYHNKDISIIKDFLISYAMDKYSISIDKSQIKMKTCQVPLQPNMNDCGVHVILNIKKFLEDPSGTIQLWNSLKPKCRASSLTVNEFFEKNGRNTARFNLRAILLDLQKAQVKNIDMSLMKHYEDDDDDLLIIENVSDIKDAKVESNNKTNSDKESDKEPDIGTNKNNDDEKNKSDKQENSSRRIESSFNTNSSMTSENMNNNLTTTIRGHLDDIPNENKSTDINNETKAKLQKKEDTSKAENESTTVGNDEDTHGNSSVDNESSHNMTSISSESSSNNIAYDKYETVESRSLSSPTVREDKISVSNNQEADDNREDSFSQVDTSQIIDSDVNLLGT
ncbi:hypothetical protein Kpol_401p13 [Vanderwaltozyma polyspora DSM 70294]|uniref:Ubiquitin-like protease family profile domain-containing protein n=1 Tax=Vanderwaltozyma polyspora (strain ATCC 22028 / DSM 70294 / BCRC 21397 / CBS 2163 / NBRC 10782 / NRRL Y-8283 / UCD 57-17) TaxID=436907 RepID=A7TRB0_VANPO|nr:uncharacterized protein Kpol_401p13 [Vanderwaltozyma polyspora DSM 70294]EDO15206.1 hypothetical protein Kpol_401p13 [Vanderwaltozyma polyspora DSM 70294]